MLDLTTMLHFWKDSIPNVAETLWQNREYILYGLGIPMGTYALMQLLGKEEENKNKSSKYITLESLAKGEGGWASEEKNVIDILELVHIWRAPEKVLSPNYILRVRHRYVQEFYNSLVVHANWFADRKKDKHRAVIIQILEMLDANHPCPSVVKNAVYSGDHDNKWPTSHHKALSKVTLMEHAINTCELGVSTLVARKEQHRIPDMMIAFLAHDLGKTKGLNVKKYCTGEHPQNSFNILQSFEYFKDLAYSEEIGEAILAHHSPKLQVNSMGYLLQQTDWAARRAEFNEIKLKESKMPEWIAATPIPNRNVAYAPHKITPDDVAHSPKILFTVPDMDNQILGHSEESPQYVEQLAEAELIEENRDQVKSVEEVGIDPQLLSAPVRTNSTLNGVDFPDKPEDLVSPAEPEEEKTEKQNQPSGKLPERDEDAENEVREPQLGTKDPKWQDCYAFFSNLPEGQELTADDLRSELKVGKIRAEAMIEALCELLEQEEEEQKTPEPEVPISPESEKQNKSSESIESVQEVAHAVEPESVLENSEEVQELEEVQHAEPVLPEPPQSEMSEDELELTPEDLTALFDDPDMLPGEESQKEQEDHEEQEVITFDDLDFPESADKHYASTGAEIFVQQPVSLHGWFDAGKFMHSLGKKLDLPYRWVNKEKIPHDLERYTGNAFKEGGEAFYFGVSQPQGVAWVHIAAIRQIAAIQLAEHDINHARILFESRPEAAEREYQNMIIHTLVTYFQQTRQIDIELLPESSPFFSIPCTVYTKENVNLGQRRMIPFRLYGEFYENWEEARQRKMKGPKIGALARILPMLGEKSEKLEKG